MWFCTTCSIPCSSEHSKQAHLNGKKHRMNLKRKDSVFSETRSNSNSNSSNAFYGAQEKTLKASSASVNHNKEENAGFHIDYKLTKDSGAKVEAQAASYPLFSPKKPARFDEIYKNAFRRKKDVNLYINGGQVFWEFAFDRTVMDAIKQYIPGRTWNPNSKKWSNPIESLPDAIELYEYMGRTPNESLKKRAKEVIKACGGTNPTEIITLPVHLDIHNTGENQKQHGETISLTENTTSTRLGTVNVQFMYNSDIVSAIKNLPPTQRSFNPVTKQWPIDLLALPELLEHLEPLGYSPCEKLTALGSTCRELVDCMDRHQQNQGSRLSSSPAKDPAQQSSYGTGNGALTSSIEDTLDIPTMLPQDEDPAGETHDIVKAQLGDTLKNIMTLFTKHKEERKEAVIDRADCGESKRRKLTPSQELWALKKMIGSDDDYNLYDLVARRLMRSTVSSPAPIDCDCGKPWKITGGTHVCRYFGTFQCSCGHTWTSAYTWKSEMQSCKSCNKESVPIHKEQLQPGKGKGGGGGHHDSSRCSRCRRLGHDCSSAF
jgi:hypothetical protein